MPATTFDAALSDSERFNKRHVLLGNGFSIACRPDTFQYDALLDQATFEGASTDVRGVFDLLGTTDFERVIELLRLAADLCERYASTDPDLAARLRADADIVRTALAHVLAARHPEVPFDIVDEEYAAARAFLTHFERIYTLNYDMLLYWTVMQEMEPQTVRNDGFGNPDDPEADYVVWMPYEKFPNQRLFYLHGGLHLYDSGTELAKITWSRTQVPLITQIRDALDEGRYPLIVTEGSTDEKLTKILHSAYLNHAIRSFATITGCLFVYGLSLAPNDEHLIRRIAENMSLKGVYVSLYGDADSPTNQAIVGRASQLALGRPDRYPLELQFYDAASATVWG
ncbi:MAG: DUF4917 family protein [Acidimicrobiales bacterium]